MITSRYRLSFYSINIALLVALLVFSRLFFSKPAGLVAAIPLGFVFFFQWRRFFFLRILPDRLYVYTPFRSRNIPIDDIRAIWLWGRIATGGTSGDAVTILTADGRTIHLADQVCGNMREIRQALLDRSPREVRDAPVIVSRPFWADCSTESFRGKFFVSINALPVYLFALFLGFVIVVTRLSLSQWQFFLPPAGMLWLLLGRQLFYFRLTADSFEVRNLFFPWVRKTWPLDDLHSIVFEFIQGKGTMNILGLHTNDLRSKHYYATSLRNRDWLALGIALQKRGIRVKNELRGVRLPDPEAGLSATAETR